MQIIGQRNWQNCVVLRNSSNFARRIVDNSREFACVWRQTHGCYQYTEPVKIIHNSFKIASRSAHNQSKRAQKIHRLVMCYRWDEQKNVFSANRLTDLSLHEAQTHRLHYTLGNSNDRSFSLSPIVIQQFAYALLSSYILYCPSHTLSSQHFQIFRW